MVARGAPKTEQEDADEDVERSDRGAAYGRLCGPSEARAMIGREAVGDRSRRTLLMESLILAQDKRWRRA